MWGTDGTRFYTMDSGWCWLFATVDHFNSECLGWHITKYGDRYAALEPVRQAVTNEFRAFEKGVATGLSLRMDNGSQYTSGVFEDELDFLGIAPSFTEPYSPESNGIAERFFRTLKEQAVWGHHFETLEQAQEIIGTFIRQYNESWLLKRLNYVAPKEAKERWYNSKTILLDDKLVSNQLVA
jgi:transposase InsO family protein